jgi:hypothetical protein
MLGVEFHTKRVRRMLGISMYHVEKHRIVNTDVLKRFGMADMNTILDLQIIQWVTKIALMQLSTHSTNSNILLRTHRLDRS